jgi:hypothetical protein
MTGDPDVHACTPRRSRVHTPTFTRAVVSLWGSPYTSYDVTGAADAWRRRAHGRMIGTGGEMNRSIARPAGARFEAATAVAEFPADGKPR